MLDPSEDRYETYVAEGIDAREYREIFNHIASETNGNSLGSGFDFELWCKGGKKIEGKDFIEAKSLDDCTNIRYEPKSQKLYINAPQDMICLGRVMEKIDEYSEDGLNKVDEYTIPQEPFPTNRTVSTSF